MNIDELTIKQVREIQTLASGIQTPDFQPFRVGGIYFIQTATMHYTGRVVAVGPTEIVIEDAAWIPDTGRFADALEKAEFDEVEPFPEGGVILGRLAIIGACPIKAAPRKQK